MKMKEDAYLRAGSKVRSLVDRQVRELKGIPHVCTSEAINPTKPEIAFIGVGWLLVVGLHWIVPVAVKAKEEG